MAQFVQPSSDKKLSNIKPVRALQSIVSNAENFTNIQFPFGKNYGPKVFGNIHTVLKSYTPVTQVTKINQPGEGLPRVIHYCADQSGCAFWRMLWPSNELLAYNKAVVMTLYQMVLAGNFYNGISAVRLQRQCTVPQLEFIKFLRNVSNEMKSQTGKGFRIIWEVDDIILPACDIPDYNVCKSAFEGDDTHNNMREIVKYIDEITVVSSYMKSHYAKHLNFDKITVIPNYAPKNWIDKGISRETVFNNYHKYKNKPRVLYAGSGTHFDVSNRVNQMDDFAHVVDRIIKDIKIDKKYEWVFFGAVPLKLKQYIGSGIEFHEWASIDEYTEILKKLNVNVSIAPLEKNNFTRSKANIKLTEAGAQGIPCIAQNLECYNSDGWEYVFDTADQLFEKIEHVLQDEDIYMKASDDAREISSRYILQNHLDEYILLYTTEYGDLKRKENKSFLRNNPQQFQ